MKLTTLAASLISAGLATIITAAVVEKKITEELTRDIDERIARELQESVEFLESRGIAEATPEYKEKRAAKATDLTKPPLDEMPSNNERIRYDQVLKPYVSGEGVSAEDGTTMLAEVQAEGELEKCDTLPDIHAISADEFFANESEFMQSSISYFADGGVLDENGELVDNFVDLIGNAIPPFGELSGEPHIVYLRNTKQRREFEVIRDDANAADILGVSDSP